MVETEKGLKICPKVYYPNQSDIRYLTVAFKECLKSNHRSRHGAVVKKANKVSKGYNRQVNHPKIVWPDRNSIHAEKMAIRNHPNPKRASIYVVRLNQNLYPAISRPCSRCLNEIADVGIRKIIYSDPSKSTGYGEIIV